LILLGGLSRRGWGFVSAGGALLRKSQSKWIELKKPKKNLTQLGKAIILKKDNYFRMKPWKPGGLQGDPGFGIIEINKN